MSRRGKFKSKQSSERWLLTYADLMNNLLILFIMLFAMSNIDAQKYQQLVEQLTGTFAGGAQIEAEAAGLGSDYAAEIPGEAGENELNAGENELNAGENELNSGEITPDFEEVYQLIQTQIADSGYEDQIVLEKGNSFIKISFGDNVLFYPDSAVIRTEQGDVLQAIGDILYNVEANVATIEIAGHTANTNVRNGFFSWELSADRSIAVLARLVDDCHLPESKMCIAGFSRYQPVASNQSEDGRKLNRRVEIKITEVN